MTVSRELLRAIGAFLVLPGVIAYAAPLWIARGDPGARALGPLGLPLVALGSFLLLWCVRDFYVSGKGTLAPWAPPKNLVVVGLYRWTRNPMYVSVLLVLAGWTVGFWSRSLLVYTALVAVAFHLRVVFGEEPFLARTHGQAWEEYRKRVRRW